MEWVLAAYIGAAQTASAPIGGVSHDGYEWGALSLQTAAGMEWRTYRGFAAAAEYKFTRTRQNVTVAGGDARAVFASHHVVFGVAWHSN